MLFEIIIYVLFAIVCSILLLILAWFDVRELRVDLKNLQKVIKLIRDNFKSQLFVLAILIINIYLIIDYVNFSMWQDIVILIIGLILLYSALVDYFSQQINMYPVYAGLIIGLVYNIFLFMELGILNIGLAVMGFALFGFIHFLSKGKGMGAGDMYILALMGMVLGVKVIIAFYVMVFSASIIGTVMGMIRGNLHGIRIAFVPYMYLGFIVALLWGDTIIRIYNQYFLLGV